MPKTSIDICVVLDDGDYRSIPFSGLIKLLQMSLLQATLDVYQAKWKNWVKSDDSKAIQRPLQKLIRFVDKSFQLQTLKDGVQSKVVYKITAAKKTNVLFFKKQFSQVDPKVIDCFIHYIPFKLETMTKEREEEISQLRAVYEQEKESKRQEKLKQDQKLRKQYENNPALMSFMKRANSLLPNFTPTLPKKQDVTQKKPQESSYKVIFNQMPTLLLCNQPGNSELAKQVHSVGQKQVEAQEHVEEEGAKLKMSRRLFENNLSK